MKKTWMIAIVGVLLAGPAYSEAIKPRRVERRLGMLPMYSIYDYFAFQVDGSKVILKGQVYQPMLKSRAENAVRSIAGVTEVENRIEVLPKAKSDDILRVKVARAVYGSNGLVRSPRPGGPTIHVIVKDGDVKLEGYVSDDSERKAAVGAASMVWGVVSVQDNLRLRG